MLPNVPQVTAPTRAVLQSLLNNQARGVSGLTMGIEAHLSPGTLHPALARLERLGWVESWWQETDVAHHDGPRRRHYRLTGRGGEQARHALREAEKCRAQWGLRWQPATDAP